MGSKDDDIYAALVKAYTINGNSELAEEFMENLSQKAESELDFKSTQDTIALIGGLFQ